jgi:toxin YoeB
MRLVAFDDKGLEHLEFWHKNDKKIVKKIFELIKDIKRDPFNGIRKPEPLKNNLNGFWSRRINDEHRLVYTVNEDVIIIIKCKNHYDD